MIEESSGVVILAHSKVFSIDLYQWKDYIFAFCRDCRCSLSRVYATWACEKCGMTFGDSVFGRVPRSKRVPTEDELSERRKYREFRQWICDWLGTTGTEIAVLVDWSED